MSNIDKRGLREAAEKATKGRWAVEFDDEIYSTDGVNHEQIAMVFSENEARDAAFIAAANPATVLALLDELEAAEKRIAELEARSFNPAILDVVAERQRQQSVKGWTPEHDNAYQNSELADAAACYAIHAHNQGFSTPAHWPWSPDWWKQSGARCDLVKAGALILAEIERIDRAAGIGVKGE
ncbi:ead/Ea22-like family protein [Escherichia coli]|nr:ead/Ea22-like family protein [Escherichia coli]